MFYKVLELLVQVLVLADFDEVLKNLDKEGAIEENMLFLNRGLALRY